MTNNLLHSLHNIISDSHLDSNHLFDLTDKMYLFYSSCTMTNKGLYSRHTDHYSYHNCYSICFCICIGHILKCKFYSVGDNFRIYMLNILISCRGDLKCHNSTTHNLKLVDIINMLLMCH
jgi:hypothetical protein